jgi:hypothetical protein
VIGILGIAIGAEMGVFLLIDGDVPGVFGF